MCCLFCKNNACLGASCNILTETARLLRNVLTRKSVRSDNIDLELSHGFAFSQEEGGAVSQAEVIRAYNTTNPKPEGT
ncbi:hypothetical protein HHI36_010104 [Cryptolaemus montrouzieri]|uniref:Uncharacterized protein n=1 Tax=Cryptolaemus montrouzieri TaxID=559131 RepID=A0ABD2MHS9_9CUCU